MSSGTSQKICVVCGADCNGRPRVKDPRGRYYCQPCYDDRKQQVAQRQQQLHDDSPLADMLEETAPPAAAAACTGCGSPLAPGAVICVNCGYNTRDQTSLSPVVESAPRDRGMAIWPILVGVICITFGAGGVLLYGLIVAMDAFEGQMIGAGVGLLPLGLSAWLALGGIGLLRRQSSAVAGLQRWAIAKAALSITCMGLLSLLIAVFASNEVQEQLGLTELELPIAAIQLIVLGMLAWLLALPAFILIWFRLDFVKNEIETWD